MLQLFGWVNALKKRLITIKEKVLFFLDRRKHTKDKNIRLAIIVLCLVFIAGMFCPLLRVRTSLSIVNDTNPNSKIEIFNPESDVISVTTNDFIFRKELKDFELFNKEIGNMDLFGINLYDFLRTEMPSYDELKNVEDFLDSGAMDFLINEDYITFCDEYLGDFGNWIVSFGRIIYDFAMQAKEVISGINDALDTIHNLSYEISSKIINAEDTLTTVDNVFLLFFLLVFALLVYSVIGKGPRFLAPVALTVISVLFIGTIVVVAIINSAVANGINSALLGLQTAFTDWLDSIFPASLGILSLLSIDSYNLSFACDIFCGAGMWLMTLSLVVITVLEYVRCIGRKKKKDIISD